MTLQVFSIILFVCLAIFVGLIFTAKHLYKSGKMPAHEYRRSMLFLIGSSSITFLMGTGMIIYSQLQG